MYYLKLCTMKTTRIILLTFTVVALLVSCSKQSYWEIPTDENGNAIITPVSKTTSTGISMLDGSFTVQSTLPNTNIGDEMTIDLVKPQVPSWDPKGATQILPITGATKKAKVDANKQISVTYTRAESTLLNLSDYVTVIISGNTDSGKLLITLGSAFTVTKPASVTKTTDAAFSVKVAPKSAAYTGNLVVKVKNGAKGTWSEAIGSPFSGVQPFSVPVKGADFVKSDTLFYTFTAAVGNYSEVYSTSVIVSK